MSYKKKGIRHLFRSIIHCGCIDCLIEYFNKIHCHNIVDWYLDPAKKELENPKPFHCSRCEERQYAC